LTRSARPGLKARALHSQSSVEQIVRVRCFLQRYSRPTGKSTRAQPPAGSLSHRSSLHSCQTSPAIRTKHSMTRCPTAIVVQKRRRRDDRYHPPKAADGVTRERREPGLAMAEIQRSRRSARSQPGGADLFWVASFGAWAYALGRCLAMVTRFGSLRALRFVIFRHYAPICFLVRDVKKDLPAVEVRVVADGV